MTARIVQVIYSDDTTHGSGRSMDDIVRRIPKLYTLDGDLICSYDFGPDGKAPPVLVVNDHALRKLERQKS